MADPTDDAPGGGAERSLPPYPSSGEPPAYPPGPGPGYPPPPGYPPQGYPAPGGYGYGYGYGYGPGPGPGVPAEVYARYWPRVGGWIIDFVIVWVVTYIISIPLRSLRAARITITTTTNGVQRTGHFSWLGLVVEIAIVLVYGAVFCGSARGQTPGMMVVGVRAVDRDTGGPIGFLRALGRGAFEYLMFVVLLVPWILDMLFPLWDSRRQTLHDKVSRTVVVKASLYPRSPPR